MVHDVDQPGLRMALHRRLGAVDLRDHLLGDDLLGSALPDDLPVADDVDPVAVHGREIEVVQGAQGGAVEPLHDVEHLQLVLDVQVVRRLVEDHAGSLLGEGAREDDPLLLPSGQGREPPVPHLPHVHLLQGVLDDLMVLVVVELHHLLVRGPPHQHYLLHLELEVVVVVLSDHGHHVRGVPEAELVEDLAVEVDLPALALHGAVHRLQDGRLAGAVGSEQPHELALVDADVRALDDPLRGLRHGYGEVLRLYVHQLLPPPNP